MSTYPPRSCGIATFTHDLAMATGDREIVVLHGNQQVLPYPLQVHHRIRREERSDYARAAQAVDVCADVVSIQHEYSIWGGVDGEYVLDFVQALRIPAVTTLHTVRQEPTAGERAVLCELIDRSAATVVMSRAAAQRLETVYGIDRRRLEVIPHGVPDLPLVDPDTIKESLDIGGRAVLLSFGLLAPGKGYELVLEALPDVVAANPAACYVILGATHPDVLLAEGEAYRQRLVMQVERLGLEANVRFVDRFVGRVELTRWLEAADVIVTPNANLDQVVSGTLAYAMSAGRAIVSTPFTYATELLADGRGLLVPAGSARALANSVVGLLGDPELRAALGRQAHAHSRGMVWTAVGAAYRTVFEQAATRPLLPLPAGSLAAIPA